MFEGLSRLSELQTGLQRFAFMRAIRKGLMLITPVIMVGSMAILVNNLPIPAFQDMMISLFGDEWKDFGVSIWNATFGIMSFMLALGVSYSYAAEHRLVKRGTANALMAAIVSFVCFIVHIQDSALNISFSHAGATGLFIAFVIALTATPLFLWITGIFADRRSTKRLFSDEAEPVVPQAMVAILPSVIVIALFVGLKFVLEALFKADLHTLIYEGLQKPFSNMSSSLSTTLIFNVTSHVMWFFGLHGNNVLEPVSREVLEVASQANAAAVAAGVAPTQIFTKQFLDIFVFMGGSGTTLSLIIALLIRSRRGNTRRLAKVSLLPGLFNINEIIVYGMPIVLNPIYGIPFLLTPVVLSIITYLAMASGIVPLTITDTINWTTPVIVGGYVATGSVRGALLQVVNLGVGVLIYMPFVGIADKLKSGENMKSYSRMLKEVDHKLNASVHKIIDRSDAVGNLTRVLASDMQQDLADGRFELKYQPLVAYDGKMLGVEALLRWPHKSYKYVPPNVAISIAEEAHLVYELGRWIINAACHQLGEWRRQGLGDDIYMSINLSPKQLLDPQLIPCIENAIKREGLDPAMLQFEVTEQSALGNEEIVSRALANIRALGAHLAMDDFGMGHSSLLYVRRFPLACIKIDGSIVRDVVTDSNCQDIIRSITALCNALGINMIAEFVETAEQRDKLLELGCGVYQGYYYSRPVDAQDIARIMRDGIALPEEHEQNDA